MSAYKAIVASNPKLKRGRVWCHECGKVEDKDMAYCLEHGWPECCGKKMETESPEEREARMERMRGTK